MANRNSWGKKEREDVASFVSNGNSIDWQRWKSLEGKSGSYNDKIKEGLLYHLVDIGILSFNPEGNHQIVGTDVNLCPRVFLEIAYFTSREQARAYANAIFAGAHYAVRIEKISDVECI